MINGVSVALPVIQTGLGSEKTVVTKMGKGNIQVKGLFSLELNSNPHRTAANMVTTAVL